MKLLLDAGNSRIKWQLRDGVSVVCAGVGQAESADLFNELDDELWARVESVAVCTVRSEIAREALEHAIGLYTRAPVRFFWTEPRFGDLVCAYEQPSTMGADRWCAMIAAWHAINSACVVIDAGSAITVDWISARGRHEGGYILPGRNLMLDSLSQKTARVLFQRGQDRTSLSPGRSTSECVLHGVNWLLRALAVELARDAAAPVLVTGGDGAYIKKALEESADPKLDVRLCPDLVIDGLAQVASH
ncbi:type III pantothenate kinase [Marinobacter sp.]|uniref:type III pantothenate kinase n=1 Tax=Marinobacter sp. TaxID=50741 RepID=UPI0035638464